MQIAHALKRAGSSVEVLHTVQILDEALSNVEVEFAASMSRGQGSGSRR
jgi:hypothetical protein